MMKGKQLNKQTLKRVEDLLRILPTARDDDHILYITYIENYYNVEFSKETFKYYKECDLPSFKTIERCRRFIQNTLKRYLSKRSIEKARKEAEKEYKNFEREGKNI